MVKLEIKKPLPSLGSIFKKKEKPTEPKPVKQKGKGIPLPKVSDVLSKLGLKQVNELVGIDVGSSSIKICVLKKTKTGGFKLQHMIKKSYEENLLNDGIIIDEIFVADELRSLFAANNIKCTDVACALSSYTVITKKIAVPFLEEEALEATIGLEAENVIPFPLNDIYFSHYVMGIDSEKEDMMNVQIVAAKKDMVDSFNNVCQMAGLKLHILDVDIFGITNLIEQIYDPSDASVVVADIGAAILNIAILKGENIEFTREILLGGKYLTSQIEKSLKLSFKEAEEKKVTADPEVSYLFEDFIFNISSEINKTINFYLSTKPNETVGKIYLTGGSSLLNGIIERINIDTGLEVEHLNPFAILDEDEKTMATFEEFKEINGVALYLSSRITDLT